MSTNINKSIFVGNLTRDVELSYTQSGFAISKMSIAVNRSVKKNDQWEDRASYFELKGLGKRFESLHNYLTKGTCIAVECYADQERWEKDGQKRSRVVFVIDNIQLVGKREDNRQQSNKPIDVNFNNNSGLNGSGSFEDKIPF